MKQRRERGFLNDCVMLFGSPIEVQSVSPPSLLLLDVFALRKVVLFSLVLQHLHYCFPRLLMPSSEILTDRTLIDPVRGHAPVPQMERFMNWHILQTSSDDPVTVLPPFYLREPM